MPRGAVLVVGSGNSGCQIADELLPRGRRVFLAISRHSRVPRRYRGKDVIWWYENLGRFDVNIDTFPGKRYPPTIIITGIDGGYDLDSCRLGHAGATLLGRAPTPAGLVANILAGPQLSPERCHELSQAPAKITVVAPGNSYHCQEPLRSCNWFRSQEGAEGEKPDATKWEVNS